jgi:hypothetical protein
LGMPLVITPFQTILLPNSFLQSEQQFSNSVWLEKSNHSDEIVFISPFLKFSRMTLFLILIILLLFEG